jgi:hypothetical protein
MRGSVDGMVGEVCDGLGGEEGAWTWLRQLAVLEGKWVKEASMVAAEGGTCMDLRRRPPMSPHSSISPTFTGRPVCSTGAHLSPTYTVYAGRTSRTSCTLRPRPRIERVCLDSTCLAPSLVCNHNTSSC